MFRIFLITTFLLYYFTGFTQLSFNIDSLDNYIEQGISDWKIPGLAIAIVKDGQIVLQKGYGIKDLKTNEPVTATTNFFIASNSKLFTGMALAKLDLEKKISLNDKITKYYPKFKLFSDDLTSQVTIKDMLTHRIGTKTFQGDFTFWNSNLSSEQVMEKMQFLQPVNAFRDVYGYCNSCYLTAGMIIPKVTEKSWGEYVSDEFLTPLKMKNSFAFSKGMKVHNKNMATPYTSGYTNVLTRVPFDKWENLAPAAAIISNVKDMTNWLNFQLDSGKFEGKQIVPWTILQKTRDVQISTGSRKSSNYPTHFRGYGLGLFSCDYNAKQVYWHTGGAGGMLSNVCFVPEERLGIVILTNNDNQSFFELLRYQILDLYLDVPYTNRSKSLLKIHNEMVEKQVDEIKEWKIKAASNEPKNGRDLDKYVGKYSNQLYGTIDISRNETILEVRFNAHDDLTANMMYIGDDNWMIEYNNMVYGIHKTNFIVKENNISGIFIKINEFVESDAYEFKKI